MTRYKAGGGLNLTQADALIHDHPGCDPATEPQATARAHRIDRTWNMPVCKLVAQSNFGRWSLCQRS